MSIAYLRHTVTHVPVYILCDGYVSVTDGRYTRQRRESDGVARGEGGGGGGGSYGAPLPSEAPGAVGSARIAQRSHPPDTRERTEGTGCCEAASAAEPPRAMGDPAGACAVV